MTATLLFKPAPNPIKRNTNVQPTHPSKRKKFVQYDLRAPRITSRWA